MGREEYDRGGDGPEPPWNEVDLIAVPGSNNWAVFVVPAPIPTFRLRRLIIAPTPTELWVLSMTAAGREQLLSEIPAAALSPVTFARFDLDAVDRGGSLRVQLDWRRADGALPVRVGVFGL